jgi:4-hydroxymandelate oxidase
VLSDHVPYLDLADVARDAAASTPPEVWDFVAGGSGAELTVAANRAALDALYLVPRVLRDVARPSASAVLLGRESALPVAVAPMAYQCLLHPEGELAAARAADAAGIPFVVPMLSSVALEDLAAADGRRWLQLYWLRDRGRMTELLARGEAAGCEAVVLTVDVPRMGRRLRDARNHFTLPTGVRAANLADPAGIAHTRSGGSALARHTDLTFDAAAGWADVDWLLSRSRLPVILKGVLDPADAERAADGGAAAVIVSNHGGRQLDGALPSITALPAVVAAVDGTCPVLLDSGVRSGLDVLKALALGASGVLLGRPVLWGLAAGGTAGVGEVLRLLSDELELALALTGCPDVAAAAQLTVHHGPGSRP